MKTINKQVSLWHKINCIYYWLAFWFKDIYWDKQQGFWCQECGIKYPLKGKI
jgi:hypothetical protein